MILNIETSSAICSVALCHGGEVCFHIESEPDMQHAACLAPYIERCMNHLTRREESLDAVAVSIGPGSYTGLRIGLSMAKGLCMSRNIPLIGIPTLEILAVKAMFNSFDREGDELLVAMTDARRMEVYTAVYDFALNPLMKPQPMILDKDSYSDFRKSEKKMIFVGDAVDKARTVINFPTAEWIKASPLAIDMNAPSEKAFREGSFMDIAYATPEYLKEYQATVSKPKF